LGEGALKMMHSKKHYMVSRYIVLVTLFCLSGYQWSCKPDQTAPGNSISPSNGQKPVQITVQPAQAWTSTGITYQAGQQIVISASGILNWFTGGCNGKCISSPDGLGSNQTCPATQNPLVAPGLKCYSLIGRIGNGEPFQVGSCYSGVAATSGELQLGVNDENFPDNTGGWQAVINPELPVSGDVVIYWDANHQIRHSGYVSAVNGCMVTGFNCLYQRQFLPDEEWTDHSPDDPILLDQFGTWTVYHTDRPYLRKINNARLVMSTAAHPEGESVVEGITDKGVYILLVTGVFSWLGHNCHGYTFDADAHEIAGYVFPSNLSNQHVNPATDDQGMAVEIILHDNGYRQVFAQGPDGKQHFDEIYSVGYFDIPTQ
jgi:hypothetical protein